jgi:hypothetical protein
MLFEEGRRRERLVVVGRVEALYAPACLPKDWSANMSSNAPPSIPGFPTVQQPTVSCVNELSVFVLLDLGIVHASRNVEHYKLAMTRASSFVAIESLKNVIIFLFVSFSFQTLLNHSINPNCTT